MAEEEEKIYVSGKVSFMKDDPGRQVPGHVPIHLPPARRASANARDRKSARSTP